VIRAIEIEFFPQRAWKAPPAFFRLRVGRAPRLRADPWSGLLKFIPNPRCQPEPDEGVRRGPGGPPHTGHYHYSTINWPFIFLCPIPQKTEH
jgi:hypothetical protein